MIKPCSIIFGCLAVGELVVWALHLSLPGSIIGMLVLTALLQMKLVKLEWVKPMSDFLVSNLGFFFIPPGVALMLYFDVIMAYSNCHARQHRRSPRCYGLDSPDSEQKE